MMNVLMATRPLLLWLLCSFPLVLNAAPMPLAPDTLSSSTAYVVSFSREYGLAAMEDALSTAEASIVRQLQCTKGVVATMDAEGHKKLSSMHGIQLFSTSDSHDDMAKMKQRMLQGRGEGKGKGDGGKGDGGKGDGGKGGGSNGDNICRPPRGDYELTETQVETLKSAVMENIRRDTGSFAGSLADSMGELLRLVFHDAAPFSGREDSTGGLNGCVDLAFSANAGLHLAITFLEEVQENMDFDVTMADLSVLAAMAAVEAAGGPVIPFKYGRGDADCFDAPDDFFFPNPESNAARNSSGELDESMVERLGLSRRQVTALLGAHTLGRLEARFSGYEGGWVRADQRALFDNAFYTGMINLPWVKTTKRVGSEAMDTARTLTEWRIPLRTSDSMMLNTDGILGFDITDSCNVFGRDTLDFFSSENVADFVPDTLVPCAERTDEYGEAVQAFAADNEVFKEEFASAFVQLVETTHQCGRLKAPRPSDP
mmetsp:Transcript_30541/g.66940  ORF Transcript_30541/g.66940 Transcript_30541/m.66940 type:complete len:485 (+) Transcript_30541:225-1679(+)